MTTRAVTLPGGIVLRVRPRAAVVIGLLAVVAVAVSGYAVLTGSYRLSPGDALGTFVGGGTATDRFFVLQQRLPRAVAALLVGAGLGCAGSLFQSVSRNPLGSPDVIGFTTGSATGALLSLLVLGPAPGSGTGVGVGALIGGLVTAGAVYAISSVRGAGGRQQLVLVGIAVGAMLASVNDYLLTRADLDAAETAKSWLFGSLNAISWPQVVPAGVALAVLLPFAVPLGRPLRLLEMGDDFATALGVRTARVRWQALLVGVLLTGAAVAVAGPVGFLALAAPQLARPLLRSSEAAPLTSAVTGAALLAAADLGAQRLLTPFQIPVGLVTGALGGAYLAWLLATGRSR
ncbi:FecCD family ABC transporter permease [Amycolatopsis sp. NBC_01480]|uniref:FecCD family ABC transporter permease n=1 Tax=Amycolatopsis sp. NBC_01480 TaxID=2903562 RepID=UPI002E29C08E|nr:iron chelate uptake ABC transporter family permease subunit [Amycolatopsis sp. NBC_01480]